MTSPFPPLADLLTGPGVADLVAETAPWWLWTADGARLVATNSSGARAMGATGVGIAIGRTYSPTHAFAGQVRRLAGQAGFAPTNDRLRVFGRFGSESAVVEVRAIEAGGERLVALRLAALRRGTARDAAIAFVSELPTPALIFAEDGTALGASAPATGIANLPLGELLGTEHARVAADIAREGRSSVALVSGSMTLVRVAAADAVVALLPGETAAEAPVGLRLVEPAAAPAPAEPEQPVSAEVPADEAKAQVEIAGEETADDEAAVEASQGAEIDAHAASTPTDAASAVAMEDTASLTDQPAKVSNADATGPLPAAAAMEEPAEAPTAAAVPVESAPAENIDIPARFSWRMDGALRFHSIEPSTMSGPVGLTFAEASERFGLDPDGQFDRAVSASRPFSGVPAVWPLGSGMRRVAVTLAAFPTLRDGALQGYAGFGLVVEEVAPAAPLAVPPPAGPLADGAAGSEQPDGPLEPVVAAQAEAGPAEDVQSSDIPEPDIATELEAPAVEAAAPAADAEASDAVAPVPADGASGKSLGDAIEQSDPAEPVASATASPAVREAEPRPVLTVHTNPPNVVALRSSAGIDPRRPALSPGERNAFREIARALGARAEGDDDISSQAAAVTPGSGPATEPAVGAVATDDDIAVPAEAIAPGLDEGEAKGETVAEEAPASEAIAQPAPADETDGAQQPAEAQEESDDAAEETGSEASGVAAVADVPPPVVIAPPMAQQRSVVPPAFLATPPIAPLVQPAAATRDFVDSGTPFGPLPSAFGALPSAGEPSAALPETAAGTPDPQADIRALLDRVPVGLVVHRGNQVLFANRSVLDWIGFADAEALERAGGIARLFAGDRSQADGAGDHVTLTALDGAAVPVEARLSKTSWAGEPAFLFTLRRPEADADAASETATLAELRGRLDEVEQILDTATDGIVIVNADASIESMNRSAEALFGYESAEVKGRSITALFAPESHRSALDYCDGLLSNGVASILNDGRQIIGRVKQGGLIPLYMTMGRTGPASRPKLAAVFRDMTQWKKAEEDLVAARRQAEQASSQKSDFLAKISHEIRTPLNAIIGFSEVMMEERFGPVGNERYRDYLKDIHLSGGHVLSLINDLLDLSKIEAGKLELSFTSVDLNDVIQSTVAIMQPQANRERVIIRSSLQSRLPNVVADSRSLRQIVLNLLSNSVKFTPAGGQIIVSTALSDAGEAVLRVRDTGVGMTEPELRAAMEPFRQVATSNPRATKGTGLGLPLTKALVEANRASFGISSTPNQGTLVEVVFPPTRVLAE